MKFTVGQQQRIRELDIHNEYIGQLEEDFADHEARDSKYKEIENRLAQKNKQRLEELTSKDFQPQLRRLTRDLSAILAEIEFTEVITPLKLARGKIERMGLTEEHPLWKQIYWLEGREYCLRPMHAPNLYDILSRLEKAISLPVKIFEVGTCFRKESSGREHLSEFTMLNLVELAPEEEPLQRLKNIVAVIMEELAIDYEITVEESEVYGETIDVLVEGIEVGSGAVGPHELDQAWDISHSWAGIGIGLERLIMAKEGFGSISRIGRSLIYQDGARLNI